MALGQSLSLSAITSQGCCFRVNRKKRRWYKMWSPLWITSVLNFWSIFTTANMWIQIIRPSRVWFFLHHYWGGQHSYYKPTIWLVFNMLSKHINNFCLKPWFLMEKCLKQIYNCSVLKMHGLTGMHDSLSESFWTYIRIIDYILYFYAEHLYLLLIVLFN